MVNKKADKKQSNLCNEDSAEYIYGTISKPPAARKAKYRFANPLVSHIDIFVEEAKYISRVGLQVQCYKRGITQLKLLLQCYCYINKRKSTMQNLYIRDNHYYWQDAGYQKYSAYSLRKSVGNENRIGSRYETRYLRKRRCLMAKGCDRLLQFESERLTIRMCKIYHELRICLG